MYLEFYASLFDNFFNESGISVLSAICYMKKLLHMDLLVYLKLTALNTMIFKKHLKYLNEISLLINLLKLYFPKRHHRNKWLMVNFLWHWCRPHTEYISINYAQH